MNGMLENYAKIVGETAIGHLRQLARPLEGKKVVHVNSTREGGGVAEILHRLIPMKKELGIDASWEVITGDAEFFRCTKEMHNTLQGDRRDIPTPLLDHYRQVNARNFGRLGDVLNAADVVFIHDPQPAPLLAEAAGRRGKWIWRCHIDVSRPHRRTWKYLQQYVEGYDACIFSLPDFAQPLDLPLYIIPPSIDPLSDKNVALDDEDLKAIYPPTASIRSGRSSPRCHVSTASRTPSV
jgi:trehalose synthase